MTAPAGGSSSTTAAPKGPTTSSDRTRLPSGMRTPVATRWSSPIARRRRTAGVTRGRRARARSAAVAGRAVPLRPKPARAVGAEGQAGGPGTSRDVVGGARAGPGEADGAKPRRRREREGPGEGTRNGLVRRPAARRHEPVQEVLGEDEVEEGGGSGDERQSHAGSGDDTDTAGATRGRAVGSEDLHARIVRSGTDVRNGPNGSGVDRRESHPDPATGVLRSSRHGPDGASARRASGPPDTPPPSATRPHRSPGFRTDMTHVP